MSRKGRFRDALRAPRNGGQRKNENGGSGDGRTGRVVQRKNGEETA